MLLGKEEWIKEREVRVVWGKPRECDKREEIGGLGNPEIQLGGLAR